MSNKDGNSLLGFGSSISQGLSSAGPMLNIFGLFPVLVSIAFRMSFYVIIASALVGFLAVYTGYTFSRIMRSNGGYYTYVGRIMGKKAGFITALLYFSYGLLAIPSVVLFLVFFTGFALQVPSLSRLPYEILLSLTYSVIVAVIAAKGLRTVSKFVTISSSVEVAAVIVFTFTVLFYRGSEFIVPSGLNPAAMMQALPFGILAFAGVGSSIFLSENVMMWERTISRSVKYSFLILFILMALPVFVISFTTSSVSLTAYASDPLSIISGNGAVLKFLTIMIILLAINSAVNLAAGYINALKQAASRMVNDGLLPDWRGIASHRIWIIIVVAGSLLSMIGILIAGPYIAFVVISGTVSLLFLMVHSISNAALLKYFRSTGKSARIAIPAFSTGSFGIVVAYEAIGGGPFTFSAVISIALLSCAITATIIVGRRWHEKFRRIEFNAETIDAQ